MRMIKQWRIEKGDYEGDYKTIGYFKGTQEQFKFIQNCISSYQAEEGLDSIYKYEVVFAY